MRSMSTPRSSPLPPPCPNPQFLLNTGSLTEKSRNIGKEKLKEEKKVFKMIKTT
jgi:hypothetical protein